jgi:hypothetical protein
MTFCQTSDVAAFFILSKEVRHGQRKKFQIFKKGEWDFV